MALHQTEFDLCKEQEVGKIYIERYSIDLFTYVCVYYILYISRVFFERQDP